MEITSGLEAHIKGAFRFSGVIFLVIIGIPVFLLLRVFNKKYQSSWSLLFHKVITKIVGLHVRVRGDIEIHCPTLFTSNHSSYLDIPVLGSLIQGSFVAKSEVSSWPLFGYLAKLQNTIFIVRRTARVATQGEVLRERLNLGENLILFPEGTSSDGHHILPFKSSLFSVVEKELESRKNVLIQPVSVVCTQIAGLPMRHMWRSYYAWYGDMTLLKHLWDVSKIGAFTVDVVFHPAVSIEEFGSRKILSKHCQEVVGAGVSRCVAGR